MKNIITVIVALFITNVSFAQSKDIVQAQVDLQKTFNAIKASSAYCKKAHASTKIHEERGTAISFNWDHKMEIANGIVTFSYHKYYNDFQQISYNFNIGKVTEVLSEDDSYKSDQGSTTLDCFTDKYIAHCRDAAASNVAIMQTVKDRVVKEDDDTQTVTDQQNAMGCAIDLFNGWAGFWKAEAKLFGK